jgi:hypothetical protein
LGMVCDETIPVSNNRVIISSPCVILNKYLLINHAANYTCLSVGKDSN